MHPPTLAQKLDIARRVHATFDRPVRWRRREWGRDDNGASVGFDGSYDFGTCERGEHARAMALAVPLSPHDANSLRCLCLGAAVRIQCAAVLEYDPTEHAEAAEAMCAVYTARARLDIDTGERDTEDDEAHLNRLIDWNDEDGRTFEEIRTLTADVVRHLEAQREGVP